MCSLFPLVLSLSAPTRTFLTLVESMCYCFVRVIFLSGSSSWKSFEYSNSYLNNYSEISILIIEGHYY